MENFHNLLKKIIDAGYQILSELDKKEPSVEQIATLYETRKELVNFLVNLSSVQADCFTEEEKQAAKGLFLQMKTLEKNLNKKLTALKEVHAEALKELGLQRKARSSYSEGSSSAPKKISKFIDLKTTG